MRGSHLISVQYRTKFNCVNYIVFVKGIRKSDKGLEQVQWKTTHAPLCFELQAGFIGGKPDEKFI